MTQLDSDLFAALGASALLVLVCGAGKAYWLQNYLF